MSGSRYSTPWFNVPRAWGSLNHFLNKFHSLISYLKKNTRIHHSLQSYNRITCIYNGPAVYCCICFILPSTGQSLKCVSRSPTLPYIGAYINDGFYNLSNIYRPTNFALNINLHNLLFKLLLLLQLNYNLKIIC